MADTPLNIPKAPQPLLTAGSAQKESAAMSIVSNTLAVIGFIILAIIILWGLVHLVQLSGFSFDSLFVSEPKIEVQVPQNPAPGEPMTVSWNNTSNTPGAYSFLYACATNFSFATQGQGGALNPVPCGVAINVGSSTSATMIPELKGTSSVSVPFSVVFTPDASGAAKETGSATMTVAPSTGMQTITPAQITTTPAPTKTTKAKTAPSYTYKPTANYSPVAHASSGPADLSVTIIAAGYIDPSSGALLMNRPPQPGDVVGVEFDIANIGGSTSGAYSFQAHLPTATPYTYTSPAQASLAPGAHVVSTLRFTDIAQGGGIFTVVVNPNSEITNANDEAATTIY